MKKYPRLDLVRKPSAANNPAKIILFAFPDWRLSKMKYIVNVYRMRTIGSE
jgi:hypothetical protein